MHVLHRIMCNVAINQLHYFKQMRWWSGRSFGQVWSVLCRICGCNEDKLEGKVCWCCTQTSGKSYPSIDQFSHPDPVLQWLYQQGTFALFGALRLLLFLVQSMLVAVLFLLQPVGEFLLDLVIRCLEDLGRNLCHCQEQEKTKFSSKSRQNRQSKSKTQDKVYERAKTYQFKIMKSNFMRRKPSRMKKSKKWMNSRRRSC